SRNARQKHLLHVSPLSVSPWKSRVRIPRSAVHNKEQSGLTMWFPRRRGTSATIGYRNGYLRAKQPLQNGIGELLGRARDGIEMQVRHFRRLVGGIEAGEVLDLAGFGLDVQPLRIAPDAFGKRRVHEDLDEFTLLQQIAHGLPFGVER